MVIHVGRPRLFVIGCNITIMFVLIVIIFYVYLFDMLKSQNYITQQVAAQKRKLRSSPWNEVPDFDLYLRMSSWQRFVDEYKWWFVNSYRLFWPPERIHRLVLVLDNDSKQDHITGKMLHSKWRFPRICYRNPTRNGNIYHHEERKRMYWDGFYPETCTNATYVGFVDSDTVWSSLVTPNSLFENSKPVILPRIGKHNWPCWADITEFMLGHKEVAQCMSYFPVLIKVSHIIKLRKYVENKHKKPFDDVFLAALDFGREFGKHHNRNCGLCQYSIMCNYVWYYHRDKYRFHMQMVPNQDWDGSGITSAMATLDYFRNNISAKDKTPKPRIAIHGRHLYSFIGGIREAHEGLEMQSSLGNKILHGKIQERLCYSGGFHYCAKQCHRYDRSKVYYSLFAFEFYEWIWDKRCYVEQQRYIKEAKAILEYYIETRQPVFGLTDVKDICYLLTG